MAKTNAAPVDGDEREVPEEEEKPIVKDDEEGNTEVHLPEEKPKERGTRKERRSERYDEVASRAERAETEARQARAEMAALRTQLEQRVSGVEQRAQQRQTEDPYVREIQNIRGEQESIQLAIRAGTVQDVERARTRFYELDERREAINRERIKREVIEEQRRQPQQQGTSYEEAALRNEFPDVVAHQSAVRYALGVYQQLVAEGKPDTLVTSREAMLKAAERFNLRQVAPPVASTAQQQRFGGVPAQAGGKGNGSVVRLESWEKKLATARWPEDDENVAYAKYARLRQDEKNKEVTE